MDSPQKRYKVLMNINNIRQIAYDTLFTKYIIEDLRGEEKLWEWESTDQEGLMKRMNGGYPIPGFIYTFIYPPTNIAEIEVKGGVKKYVDYVPLVFCLSIDKEGFNGINLNMLPNLERVKFLNTYYINYKSFFKDIEILTQNEILALNMGFISAATSGDGQRAVKLMSRIAGANFAYGFRKYKMAKIKILRMVEYCEWDYIPFYDPRDAFKLMNQKQIHDIYWKTK